MIGSPNAAIREDVLVGRDRELNTLRLFLDERVSQGGAMMLPGGIGIGKTALLNRAVAFARDRGMQVLRLAGVRSAEETCLSGVRKLLTPLLGSVSAGPEQQVPAIDVALGRRHDESAAVPRLVDSVLFAIQSAKGRSGLLIAIDDLQWMDPVSCQVLCLLGAHLDGTGISVLYTVRSTDRVVEYVGLPVCNLEPLDETASRAVLDRNFPLLASRVRERILAEARGNPLALMELPLPLSCTQRKAVAALPSFLPLTGRLQELYGPRVSALPEETREVLLAAALEGTGDLNALKAFAETGLETTLRLAEDAELAGVDSLRNRLVFHHPLARTTVVALATPSQRREAHRRLADALIDRPELHAWHLSQSAVAANSTTADLAHDAAMKAMSRGAVVSAVRLMTRSADLSTDPRLRARRLGYAATISADAAGDLDAASRLVQDARENDPDFDDTLPAIVVAATTFLNSDGDAETAHGLLVSALESRNEENVESVILLKSALWTLARACRLGSRAELWESLLRMAEKYREHLTEFELAAWEAAADPARANAERRAVIEQKIASARTERDPNKIIRLAGPCAAVDRIGEMRAALWRVAESGRNGQSTTYAIRALTYLCGDALARGRWSDVDALAGEAVRLCDENGQRALSRLAEGSVAAVAALRGDTERTRTLTRAMIAWAIPRDAKFVLHLAVHARMLESLGAADFEAAYQYVAEIGLPDLSEPTSIEQMRMTFDLVDATVHTDRYREAEAHVRAIRTSEMPSLSPRLALQAAAATALVAPRDRAGKLYEGALSLPGTGRWPYDRARVQLAYGEHLRRTRATGEARRQLRTALHTFRDLGAMPWAARAETELRAAGDRGTGSEPEDLAALTPQELAIVRLAASGLTNKQIGQRLYLSPRTVGNHLYRAFPKLGITSRAGIRDALTSRRLDPAADVPAH